MKNLILATILILLPVIVLANTHSTNLVRASNQYWSITDGSQTGLDITGDLTSSVYVKGVSFQVDNHSALVAKYDSSQNPQAYWSTIFNDGGTHKLSFTINNGSGLTNALVTPSTGNFSTGVWYHVVLVYTASSGRVDWYVNGSSVGFGTGLHTSIANSNNTFTIGKGNIPGTDQLFNGRFDDVRIWSRALSSDEISNLYNNPCGFDNGSSLQGWWKFDNNGNDSSGNGNNLTNNNTATFVTDVPYECVDSPLVDLIIFE